MKNSFVIFLLFCTQLFGQKIEFVSAKNGLVVRDAPSLNSNRIGKLDYKSKVIILRKSGIELKIEDEGKIIAGEWYEIKNEGNNLKGFVFSGFLSEEAFDKQQESGNFYLTKIDSKAIEKHEAALSKAIQPEPTYIFLRNKAHKDLSKFKISDLLMYDNSTLLVNDLYGLKNIKKLIKVQSTYIACCSNTDENYFLVNVHNELIELPIVNNMHCDGPEPFYTYIFPNEKHGKPNKLVYAKITPNSRGIDNEITILKTFTWNGTKLIE
ncbi:SH3 domain-containing protein [Seonamhaeicola marinus]|uniref:SH3 domain-containing protein n=1 Tax=Seonamhaeicola marinus TaxID=1912246 RepID=A0A5D0I9J3_9FLAO|nr:SH3 domain-containing protein [Seonamhaeicola marinus]TYA78422.1 SH3 domain-containing protein [Seonamhaeicola marinus]